MPERPMPFTAVTRVRDVNTDQRSYLISTNVIAFQSFMGMTSRFRFES